MGAGCCRFKSCHPDSSSEGKLRAETRKLSVALEDILIGATALSRGMTLATRNTSHFERLGVSMVNPFA